MDEVKFRVRESRKYFWRGLFFILLFLLVSVLPNVDYLLKGDFQGFLSAYEIPRKTAIFAVVGVFMMITNFTHGLKVYYDNTMEYTSYFGKKTKFTVYDIERSEITSTGGTKGLVIYGTGDKVLAKLEYNMEGYENFCQWLETAQNQDLENGLSREEQLRQQTGVTMDVGNDGDVRSPKVLKRLRLAMRLAPWMMLAIMMLSMFFGSKVLRARIVLLYPMILIVVYFIFHKDMIIGYPRGITLQEYKSWKKSKVRFPIFSAIMFSMFGFNENRTLISLGGTSYAPAIIAIVIYVVYLLWVRKDNFIHRLALAMILFMYILLAESAFHVAFSTSESRWVEECQISPYLNDNPDSETYAKGTLLRENGETYVIHELFEDEYNYYKEHMNITLYCYKSIFGYSCGDFKYDYSGRSIME